MSFVQGEKIIWTMWLQGEAAAPELVRRCTKTWRDKNPGYQFIFLSQDNLFDYVDPDEFAPLSFDSLAFPPRSDLVRLYLLSRYGGVWADPTSICTAPLDQWLDLGGASFFAFEKPGLDRPLANWFMASEKQGYIATVFYEAFKAYWLGRESYALASYTSLVNRYGSHPKLQWIWFSAAARLLKLYPYFINHYVFSRLLQRDREFAALWEQRARRSAEPCNLLAGTGMAAPISKAIVDLLDKDCPPVVKMSWKGLGLSVINDQQTVAGYALSRLVRES